MGIDVHKYSEMAIKASKYFVRYLIYSLFSTWKEAKTVTCPLLTVEHGQVHFKYLKGFKWQGLKIYLLYSTDLHQQKSGQSLYFGPIASCPTGSENKNRFPGL